MSDSVTTTKTTTKPAAKKDADPNAAVLDAIDNLRQALLDAGMDETTANAKLMAVQPNVTSTVGNFADLQRLGAAQVHESGGISDAFVAPAEPASAAAEASAGVVK